MPQTIERLPAVIARTGLSRSSIYSRIASGEFPRPIHLGARTVGWLSSEIDDWITRRLTSRDSAAAKQCSTVPYPHKVATEEGMRTG
jgi:prophage regulatory protein